MPLLPGTEVRARGLRWEVIRDQVGGDSILYRLRGLEGALEGREIDLVTPFETLTPVATPLDPTRAAPLDGFRVYHEAFLLEQALGPRALLAAQPGRLRIEPYQLVPVVRALSMARPRLLLADDVGLGKTIEAGLVLAELIGRRRAHRVLIVSPAGPLLSQWQQEMLSRFGLRFAALDAAALQQIRFAQELGSNPFDHVALGIVSLDFAKQEKVLADIERSHFDVVVIDEAHHVARVGSAASREDSQRRKLAEVLASKSDALLLLSATPHDGHDSHFASLIELLDPSLLAGSGELHRTHYLKHTVRRLKRHIRDAVTGEPKFRERIVVPQRVVGTGRPAYATFQREMMERLLPPLRNALKKRSFGDALAFIALLKRAVSTVSAARSTLAAVLARFDELLQKGGEAAEAQRERVRSLRAMAERSARFGTLSFEEELERSALEAEDLASDLLREDPDFDAASALREANKEQRTEKARLRRAKEIRASLVHLAALAEAAEKDDPKLAAVLAAIAAIRAEEPRANVLVYSEYADTQRAVLQALESAAKQGELEGDVLGIRGEDAESVRESVTRAFTERDGIVLVSTDASAEGLNLHGRCHHLVHVELPYNPNRLEQRNGRIDRYGQTRDPVVRTLYLADTFEERLLVRLVQKFEHQRRRLGFMPNTLGVTAVDLDGGSLVRGLSADDAPLFAASSITPSAPVDDVESPLYRDMLSEYDRVFADLDRATAGRTWLLDEGASADLAVMQEAEGARAEGLALFATDLTDFVRDAVRVDSRDPHAVSETADGVLTLALPVAWCGGLGDLPGFDDKTRVLRVARSVERERDAAGQPLAYLGRAHPVVRRALDRVRNAQLGEADRALDRRVSVARGEGKEPELLATFVGHVESRAGRELSRVVAVRLAKSGSLQTLVAPDTWQHLVAKDRALPTARVWDTHFASWARADDPRLLAAAQEAFVAIAADFEKRHRTALGREAHDLAEWLALRAKALLPVVPQLGLFDAPAASTSALPTDDLGRLAALAVAADTPAARRNEARTVLQIQARRASLLEERGALGARRVEPLGLLLLVPATH